MELPLFCGSLRRHCLAALAIRYRAPNDRHVRAFDAGFFLLHARLNFRRCRPDVSGGGLRAGSRPAGRAAIRES
jgi:hypothetical protein